MWGLQGSVGTCATSPQLPVYGGTRGAVPACCARVCGHVCDPVPSLCVWGHTRLPPGMLWVPGGRWGQGQARGCGTHSRSPPHLPLLWGQRVPGPFPAWVGSPLAVGFDVACTPGDAAHSCPHPRAVEGPSRGIGCPRAPWLQRVPLSWGPRGQRDPMRDLRTFSPCLWPLRDIADTQK